MAVRNRRLVTQTAGLAFAAVAVASVSTPHNAAIGPASSDRSSVLATSVGGTTIQANGKALQVSKMDGDDLGSLIHHRYP